MIDCAKEVLILIAVEIVLRRCGAYQIVVRQSTGRVQHPFKTGQIIVHVFGSDFSSSRLDTFSLPYTVGYMDSYYCWRSRNASRIIVIPFRNSQLRWYTVRTFETRNFGDFELDECRVWSIGLGASIK